MVSFVLMIELLSLSILTKSQDLCLMYSQYDQTEFLNGYYGRQIFGNGHNGAPWWFKILPASGTCSSNGGPVDGYIYVYYDGSSHWLLALDLDGIEGYGYCTADTGNLTAVNCLTDWELFGASGWQTVSTFQTYNGACPDWNCNGISVSGSFLGWCDGAYERYDPPVIFGKTYQNAFKKPGEELYIYYRPITNAWVCDNEIQYECPYDYILSAGEAPYQSFQPPDTPNPRSMGDIGNVD